MQKQLNNPKSSIFSSAPFKFLVGSNKKPFTVHSALIAHHSKPLDVLVNGDMLEAKEGCAFLEDIDEGTFLLFSQYAYTGDYSTADLENMPDASASTKISPSNKILSHRVELAFQPMPPASNICPDPNRVLDKVSSYHDKSDYEIEWGRTHFPKSNKRKAGVKTVSSKRSILWDNFKSKTYAISKPPLLRWKHRETCRNRTEAILDHARLYVFAEKYDIGLLKCLSLQKLHQALVQYNLRDEPIDNIVGLIQYSYSNTMDLSGSIDGLRQLVMSYAACIVEDLARNAEFQSLLEQPGSAAKDLMIQLLGRLD